MSLDDEWKMFLQNSSSSINTAQQFSKKEEKQISKPMDKIHIEKTDIKIDVDTDTKLNGLDTSLPVFDDLYISTKTKVLFLNMPINIHSIFWLIPVIEYGNPTTGVIKKQIKVVSRLPEEYEEYKSKLKDISYYRETIIKQIEQSSSNRFKFKDERKITVGLSKKDIMNCRGKAKNAFYNCFALIFRVKYEGTFREIHVKFFNTGKLEIPGIVNSNILNIIKEMIINCIQPYVDTTLSFTENELVDNVLINSNFHCGFYINREILYSILRNKYNINAIYDPCSYPGIRCIYYCKDKDIKISYMIFRTGSILIVGKCDEDTLDIVYEYIKNILSIEYENIFTEGSKIKQIINKKIKKKFILIQ